jgi:hypothetical protein
MRAWMRNHYAPSFPFRQHSLKYGWRSCSSQHNNGWKTRNSIPGPRGLRRVTCCGRAPPRACDLAGVCRLEVGRFSPRESSGRSGSHFQCAWIDSQAKARGAHGTEPKAPWAGEAAAQKIPVRVGDLGPLIYPNDDVLKALAPERVAKIKLLNGEPTPCLNTQDPSEFYAYEIANFGDGRGRNPGRGFCGLWSPGGRTGV